eukprot:EG_transcript_201
MTNDTLECAENEGSPNCRDRLVFLFLHFVGHVVQVQLKDGTVYEGVCSAISKDDFSVILSSARLKTSKVHPNGQKQKTKPREMVHIPTSELCSLFAIEVSFGGEKTFSEAGFFVDTDITNRMHMGGVERELQHCNFLLQLDGGLSLENEIEQVGKATSWDQFAVNREKFGYRSTWDESLYTTKLGSVSAEMEREAARIAREIERGEYSSKLGDINMNIHVMIERNQALERDYDEEELHSSVLRPDPLPRRQSRTIGGESVPSSGKYVPPHKRGEMPPAAPRVQPPAADPHYFPSGTEFMNQVGECGHSSIPPSAVSAADFEKRLMQTGPGHPNVQQPGMQPPLQQYPFPMDTGGKISWADDVEEDERGYAQPLAPLAAPHEAPITLAKRVEKGKLSPTEEIKKASALEERKSILAKDKKLMGVPATSLAMKAALLEFDRTSPTTKPRLLQAADFAKWKKEEGKKPVNREQEISLLKAWSTNLETKLKGPKGEEAPKVTLLTKQSQQTQSQSSESARSQESAQSARSQPQAQPQQPQQQPSQLQQTQSAQQLAVHAKASFQQQPQPQFPPQTSTAPATPQQPANLPSLQHGQQPPVPSPMQPAHLQMHPQAQQQQQQRQLAQQGQGHQPLHPSAPSTPQPPKPLQLQHPHQHAAHQPQHPQGLGEMSLHSFNSAAPPKRGPQPVVTISSILDANLGATSMNEPTHEAMMEMMGNVQHGAPAGDHLPQFGHTPHPMHQHQQLPPHQQYQQQYQQPPPPQGPAHKMHPGMGPQMTLPFQAQAPPMVHTLRQSMDSSEDPDDMSPTSPGSQSSKGWMQGEHIHPLDARTMSGGLDSRSSSLNPNAKEWIPPFLQPPASGSSKKGGHAPPAGQVQQLERTQSQGTEWKPTLRVTRDKPVLAVMGTALLQRLATNDGFSSTIGGDRNYSHLWIKPPADQKDFVYYVDLESIEDETDAIHQPPQPFTEEPVLPQVGGLPPGQEQRTGLPLATPQQYGRGHAAQNPNVQVSGHPGPYAPAGYSTAYPSQQYSGGPTVAGPYGQAPPLQVPTAAPVSQGMGLSRGMANMNTAPPQPPYGTSVMVDINQGALQPQMQGAIHPHAAHQVQQYAPPPNMPTQVGHAGMAAGASMHPQQRPGPANAAYYPTTSIGTPAHAIPTTSVSPPAWQQTPPQPQHLPAMYGYQDLHAHMQPTTTAPPAMGQLGVGPQTVHPHAQHHHGMAQGMHTMQPTQMHTHAHMHSHAMHQAHMQAPPSPQQHTHLQSPMPPNPQKLMIPPQGGKKGGVPASPSLVGGGMSLNRPTPPHSPGQEAGIMPMAPGYLPTVQIDDPLKLPRGGSGPGDTIRIAQRTAQRYAPPSSQRMMDNSSMMAGAVSPNPTPPMMPGTQGMGKGAGGYKGGNPQRGPQQPPPQPHQHQHQHQQHQHQHQQQPRRMHGEDMHGRVLPPGMAPSPHPGMLGPMPPHQQHLQTPMAPNPMQPPPPQQQQQHRGPMNDGNPSRTGSGKTLKGRQRGPKPDGM